MAAALIYQPGPRWQIGAAFIGACLLHLGAIAVAERAQVQPLSMIAGPADATLIIEPEEQASPEEVEPSFEMPLPLPPPLIEEPLFIDSKAPPVPKSNERPVHRIVRAVTPTTRASAIGSAKVFALSAPRPEYPYEARRQHATGSGIALLTINPQTGFVTEVQMLRSTGNAGLDYAAMSGFRRWRFKPGTVSSVQTPITYTLTGAM